MTKDKFTQDARLTSFADSLVANTVMNNGSYESENLDLMDRYNRELYGDEEDGLSQIVTPEVQDTVDTDLISLNRTFLGAGAPVEFTPVNGSQEAILEAKDKNAFLAWIMQTVPDSYKVQNDFLKEMLIQKFAMVQYGVEEYEKPITRRFKGLSQVDVEIIEAQLLEEFGEGSQITIETEIELGDEPVDQEFEITATIVTSQQSYFIRNIPWEDAIIPVGVQTIQEAEVFGHKFTARRGELVAKGLKAEQVRKIPTSGSGNDETAKYDRFKDEGSDQLGSNMEWANELVRGEELYMMYDRDEDGILHRMKVIRYGEYIECMEEFDHVPYAGCSAIQMPHSLIGKSRAEITAYHQRVNTVLNRNMINNIVMVNSGRFIVDDKSVNMDDLLNYQVNGIIRAKNPTTSIVPEPALYNGDKILQVVQYQESKHAQSTGQMITNQALTSDQLNQETATRFEGIEQAGKGKIELIARNVAEMFYKPLYEGLAWFAQHYQDSEMEIYLFGRQMAVNPASWKFDDRIVAKVGTGSSDDEAQIQTLGGILATQLQEIERQSGLSDNQKVYNTYTEMAKRAGIHDVSQFYNDPTIPQQQLMAENQQLKQVLQAMQAQLQQQNPLAEAEKVKQETEVLKAQLKSQETMRRDQLKAAELQGKQRIDLTKIAQDQRQFAANYQKEQDQFETQTALDIAKMELDHSTNLPGGLDEQR